MPKNHPHTLRPPFRNRHDYLPAAGHDLFLPGYDLLTSVLGMRPAYDELIDQSEIFAGADVLEIGCGTGNLTVRAKRAAPAANVTALDPDPRALARAQRKVRGRSGIRFERGYAQQLPFADDSFDKVLSSMMLHHLDADVKRAALAEARRVLRPGGSLHIVDVVGGHLALAHDADELPDLLRANGFDYADLGTRRLRLVGPVRFYRGA